MAAKFDLMEVLKDKGFERIDNPMERFGSKAEWYQRTWSKDIEVAWYGVQHFELTVTAKYLPSFNGNSSLDDITFEYSSGKVKNHACNKRAWNALRDTVTYAGYEF